MIFDKLEKEPKKQARVRFTFEMNVGVEELKEWGGLKGLQKEIREDLKKDREKEGEEWRNVTIVISGKVAR